MSPVLGLLRPDLRDFAGYASARRTQARGSVWLNANESPLPSPADPGLGLNRYPEPQPVALRDRLAELYGVRANQLLVTRGSDEGIDLLVRAFCRAGRDAVAIAPPCFGMYAVCARIQGAPLVEVPLLDRDGWWSLDLPALLGAVALRNARIVFLCSPANPTGQALALEDIRTLATALADRAILVLDEAYAEYSAVASASTLLEEFPGLVVLRTLSKAHALAGARIGVVLGDPDLVAVLGNLSAPYPVAAPSAALALAALSEDGVAQARQRCAQAIAAREQLLAALQDLPGVAQVYPSQGNYLLVRLEQPQSVLDRLLQAGIVVRDMRAMPGLGDALRISIGTPDENAALLAVLGREVSA
jgi:histidinol-phosphate aminotransferase